MPGHLLHLGLCCYHVCPAKLIDAASNSASACCSMTVQEMIDEADRNGDGEIDEEEFYRIMKKTSLF